MTWRQSLNMEITIVNESDSRIPQKFIHEWVAQVESHLKKKKILKARDSRRELTLVFLNKKPAQKINLEFRGKDYATDVLSFESLDELSFGELIMCPEVLKRQAQEHGLSFQLELGYMILHGILHLLGYDHETSEAEARKMFALQDHIFEALT